MDDLTARIRAVINGAPPLVEAYFDPAGPFAGHTFDDVGSNEPARIGPDDLFAATLLDVAFTPAEAREILVARAPRIGSLLAEFGDSGTTLWAATNQQIDIATELYEQLRFPGVGPAKRTKLLARKLPAFVPIVDSVVVKSLELGKTVWAPMRKVLQDEALREEIDALFSNPQVTLLRKLDVAIWMKGSNAQSVRRKREPVTGS